MSKGPEALFRDKVVVPWLKSIPNLKFFLKESASIRGIPDIIGCCNGKFFALELKASEKEFRKRNPRKALQQYFQVQWEEVGAFVRFVYPENWPDTKEALAQHCFFQS